jgi:phosphoserine phosphatase RsbU/P
MNTPHSDIKILVVDDSMTMRQTLEWILGRSYNLRSATDGEEGLQLYASFQPEVLLLDINMPKLDGFGVIEHIRNSMGDQDTFIIMLTAEESEGFKPKALNLGANDFLYKPFDRTELLARIGVAERQVRLTRQLRRSMERITRELELVAMLQTKLLPQETDDLCNLRVRHLYRPSGQASGDYYDFFPVQDDVLRVVVADVSGHGARAAFLMAIVRTLFRTTQYHFLTLEDTLALVNNHLNQIIGAESDFVTVFAADIDLTRERMRYINSGHTPGMLKHQDKSISTLSSSTTMLGFFDIDFVASSEPFSAASELFLFTDGFYEWEPEQGAPLDLDVFWDLAQDILLREGNFLVNLMRALQSLSVAEPRFKDDLTALWVKVEPRSA